MKKKSFNSFCVICKKPAKAPAGFSNVHKVTLCPSKVCRRTRKTELQKARRRQLMINPDLIGYDIAATKPVLPPSNHRTQGKQTRQRPTSS